jgi:hypothetical protein
MSDEDVQDREPTPPFSPILFSLGLIIITVHVTYLQTEIATFIVAGHETSSAGITWCLHCLSHNIKAQEQLRDEIREPGYRIAGHGANQVP